MVRLRVPVQRLYRLICLEYPTNNQLRITSDHESDASNIPIHVGSIDQIDTAADITASDYGQQRCSAASGDKSTTAVAQQVKVTDRPRSQNQVEDG